MPELPEVETVRRGLQRLIVGKTIASQTHDNDKSFPNEAHEVLEFMLGAMIVAVHRRAKVLLIDLSSGYSLAIHLKMTGQLVYLGEERFGAGHPSNSLINQLPDKSTRVTITFKDNSKLFFNDQRKFGWMRLLPTIAVGEIDFMKRVGPEPLEDSFTSAEFMPRLRKRANTSVKAAILDQSVLAGVGNIYADESLWGAMIHPSTMVKDLTDKQIKDLLKEIKDVMTLAIQKGGSTDRNYVNAEGKKGSYMDFARVFRRENKPCNRCGSLIQKIRVAGRGTHFCPTCQV